MKVLIWVDLKEYLNEGPCLGVGCFLIALLCFFGELNFCIFTIDDTIFPTLSSLSYFNG